MKVSIVIPNYNGRELLKANLPAILDYTVGQEIIVVDDASTDGSIEIIENLKFKIKNYNLKFKIIKNERNLGFASAVNRGVKEASGELILLLNTDIVPETNFIEPLVKHFSDPKVFAVGCLEKSIEGKETIMRGRGIGSFEKGFLMHQRGETDRTDTLWVSGGSGMFRKSIWEKLGGFDTLYNPFYWEDIDISYRAMKSGYKITFEPRSVVIHKHHQGGIRKNFSPEEIKKIAYRNQILFVWLNITDINYLLEHFLFLPLYIVKAILRRDSSFILGFFDVLKSVSQVIKSRKENRKNFLLEDKELLENFT